MEKTAGLSAPEAYLLLSLPRFDPSKALKLGFMGLVAQGLLRLEVEDRRGLFRTRHIPHLRVAPNLAEPLPPVAASLAKVVRAAAPSGLIKDVLAQCRLEYGRTLLGIMRDCLAPALVARGFAEPYRHRILGIFSVASFARTPAGDAEKARIEGLMEDARSIPQYLDRDPVQAVALVVALGGAILLVDELRPHYQALGLAMRNSGSDDSGGGDGGGGDFTFTDTGGLDAGDHTGFFDFSGVDFSAFDAGAFDSFDSGFSDAGGGDGGGGDGGSSGC